MLVVNVLEEGVYGGPQKRAVLVAEALMLAGSEQDHKGIQTKIVGPSSADRLLDECTHRSIEYLPLKLTPLSRKPQIIVKYLISFISEVYKLKSTINQQAPDIVHCSGGSWSIKACLAAKLAGVPFIWHMNDTSQPRIVLSLFGFLVRKLKPSGVLYSGTRAKLYYEHFFPTSIPWEISRPPIDQNIRNTSSTDVERPTNLPNAACNIILVGNINPTKGTDLAVRGVVRLIKEGKDISLTLAGATKSTQKQYFELVKKMAGPEFGSRIRYIGSVSDVVPYLLHSDIALCTSLSEAGPMSAWEAAATQCALVSADVGDVAEVLSDAGIFLFETGQLDDLTDKLRMAIDEPQEREARSTIAYNKSAALLVHESARSTSELYRRVHQRTNN